MLSTGISLSVGKAHGLQAHLQLIVFILRTGGIKHPLIPEIQIIGVRRGLGMVCRDHQHLLKLLHHHIIQLVPGSGSPAQR